MDSPAATRKARKSLNIRSYALLVTGLKAEANLTQALVASWAADNGKSENRNHLQRLSLVKSMCVLIHIKLGKYCLSLSSGFRVITHLVNKSPI